MAEKNLIRLERRRVKNKVLRILDNLRDEIEQAIEQAVIEVCSWPDEETEEEPRTGG